MMHDYYHKIVKHLQKLKEMYPEHSMGKHLSTVLDDQNIWGLSDKCLAECFDKYVKTLLLDVHHPEREIDKIIDEGMCLDRFKLIEDAPPPPTDNYIWQ